MKNYVFFFFKGKVILPVMEKSKQEGNTQIGNKYTSCDRKRIEVWSTFKNILFFFFL